MAGLFASLSVRRALDKLSSLLPVSLGLAPSSSSSTASQDLEVLRRLERTMRRIRATLHDAEEHWNIREESAKLRLKELKELAYDAEDVVEEYENEVERCKLEALERSACTNHKRKRQEENEAYSIDAGTVAVPNELVVQAKKIIERFDEIKDYSDNFTLSENDGERRSAPDISRLRETSSVLDDAKSILGREGDKDKIVEKLLPREGNDVACPVSVLAITGMGGLGKTTLAQLIYNDPRVRQSFDVRAWVCVSEQFDVSSITKNIISSLTKERCDLSQLDRLQEKLVDVIKEKRILLVLDDVWNERRESWKLLCAPLSTTSLCKIVVTTRSEVVARLVQTMPFYRINCLSCDDSWSLFKQVAFAVHHGNDTPANLVEIGKSIIEKCKGLPLAIKTVGSILRYQPDEMRWRDVLESELWDLEQSRNEVLPALELSYKHMPMYLKRCFVALSLLPKDYELYKSDVLWIWKSLDLLQVDGNKNKDDIGGLYFNELVQRSFLQVYFREDSYKMHDLIHDLACFLAAEEFFRLDVGTSIEIPQNARYISIYEGYASIIEEGGCASVEILTVSHSLRAIVMLPEVNRHIHIKNLEVLLLNCKKLRALTVLPDFEGESYMRLPHGIGRLFNLHTLPTIHIRRCGCDCNISELRSLNKIRDLRIHGLDDARIEDSNKAQLQSKKHLQTLELDFSTATRCCENTLQAKPVTVSHEQLLESLRPHHGLRELTIEDYMSQKYPSWLGDASFSNVIEINLHDFKSQHLPTLGELPSLKSFVVFNMYHVEFIGREFCSHLPGVKGFPSLTRLEFFWMHELSGWSEVDVGEFPCLHTLSIKYAPKLRSLPSVPFMSLVTCHLRYCENLTAIPASATLRELRIQYCDGLHQLPTLPSLWKLEIEGCPNLSAVGSLPSLTTLNLKGPIKDEMLYMLLNCHPSLECITIICGTTTCIPLQPQNLPSLAKLQLSCPNLQYCDGLAGLTSLKELKLWHCPNLPVHSTVMGLLASLPSKTVQLLNLDIRGQRAWRFEFFDS